MANPTVIINSTTYSNVPEVNIPKSGGGTAKFFYTGDADINASRVLSGYKGFGASGEVTGTLTVPTISQDGTTHVLSIS